jgi:hypothetical protein
LRPAETSSIKDYLKIIGEGLLPKGNAAIASPVQRPDPDTEKSKSNQVGKFRHIFAPSSGRYTVNGIARHLRTLGESKTPPQQSSSSQIPTDGQAKTPSTEELLARRKISNRIAMNAFRKWRKEKQEASKRLEVEKFDEAEEERGTSEGTESCTGGCRDGNEW